MSMYPSIVRGENSSEVKYTKDFAPFVHIKRKNSYSFVGEVHVCSLFVFPKVNKKGVRTFRVKVLTCYSRPSSDRSRLVAPLERHYYSYRVNPDTGAVTKNSGIRQSGIYRSLDHGMEPNEFKAFLLRETQMARFLLDHSSPL